jgi:hypothetical protein
MFQADPEEHLRERMREGQNQVAVTLPAIRFIE